MSKIAMGADTAHSAIVDDHKFIPRGGQWWGLCVTCGLARSAHKKMSKLALRLEREQKATQRGTNE